MSRNAQRKICDLAILKLKLCINKYKCVVIVVGTVFAVFFSLSLPFSQKTFNRCISRRNEQVTPAAQRPTAPAKQKKSNKNKKRRRK